MIDPQVIDKLDSANVEERKQAIKALARSKDREALAHLADVVRNDPDDEVRELARKAGIYIRQNTPEPTPAPLYDDDEEDEDYTASSLYPDDEDDEPADVRPASSEIRVSQANVERARSFLDQAMNFSVRGDNQRAADAISKALKANPRLMHDSYTMSLAANITGLPGPQAIERLGPDPDQLKRATLRDDSAVPAVNIHNSLQVTMAGITALAAVVVLVGYLVFPWIDLWSVEDPETGQTARQALDAEEDAFVTLFPALVGGGSGSAANDRQLAQMAFDYVRGLNLDPNGLETTNYALGLQNIFDVIGVFDGLGRLIRQGGELMGMSQAEINLATAQFDTISDQVNAGAEELGLQVKLSPEPPDLTLVLIPIAALVALAMTLILMLRVTVAKWVVIVVFGVIGMAAIIYFYAAGLDNIVDGTAELAQGLAASSELGMGDLGVGTGDLDSLSTDLNTIDSTELLGIGFWISAAGMLALILLPLIAMVFMPGKPE